MIQLFSVDNVCKDTLWNYFHYSTTKNISVISSFIYYHCVVMVVTQEKLFHHKDNIVSFDQIVTLTT